MAPPQGACGRQNPVGGEDCLSEASSAALNFGTGAKAPEGPRPGANGFGSFCRNKRISSCGAETPQAPAFPPLSSLYVFSHSLTMFTASFRAQFPSFVRQPPQSPLSGGLLRAPLDKGGKGGSSLTTTNRRTTASPDTKPREESAQVVIRNKLALLSEFPSWSQPFILSTND